MKKNNSSDKKNEKENKKKPPLNTYIRYTAIGFQMVAVITLGTWAGYLLDEKYGTETPWFTIGLALFSVFAALYLSLKDLIGKD